MRKVLQERGIGSLPGSTEPNPREPVKLISTAKADSTGIRPLVNLGASVSVMPFSTYTNLGLDFIILDIPGDNDVPLILGRPFLSTAHTKIDVFKRKITLRIGEEKLIFKSIKPTTSLIRKVYMLKEGTNLDSKTKLIGEAANESFDPHYSNYIVLNDLDMALEPRMDQDDEFESTLDFVNEPTYKRRKNRKLQQKRGGKIDNRFVELKPINYLEGSIISLTCG
ncbi:hypothetical protein Tco_0785754 [Tanacetum coccineum]